MEFYNKKKRLGDILIDAGIISQDQLLKALAVCVSGKMSVMPNECPPNVNILISGRGNILPEKNIRIKNGKQPIVRTSNTVLRKLATTRLTATIERLEIIPTASTAPKPPAGLYPSASAVQ
jgi:hypothetical protein